MYTVYVLRNTKNKIYIGQTSDLEKRMRDHNLVGLGYTAKYRPWVLVHAEDFPTRVEAMRREKYLKTGKGRLEIKAKISI